MMLEIDTSQEFENLPRAPIAEAVIQWRAQAEKRLDQDEFRNYLQQKLPEYPKLLPQHQLEWETQVSPEGSGTRHSTGWLGFRMESADALYVAQFTRDGLVFSRLKPYENWGVFAEEAQRLWHIHMEFANPSEVQRLGVRFINVFSLPDDKQLRTVLALPPESPPGMEMPIQSFMHQSRFDIPNRAYNLNVIQTIQPPIPPQSVGQSVILDLDVFTTEPLGLDNNDLKNCLAEMRWIKNKAFFSLLTEEALKPFRKEQL